MDTLTTDLKTWGHVFHVNFFAAIVLARGLKEELTSAQGAVVNVTSIAGGRVHPYAGAAYATSKAALAALTREMAHDFGPMGVRVNAIAPGFIDTRMARLEDGSHEHDTDYFKTVYLKHEKIPIGRAGLPDDIAGPAFFLCSDDSRYVTGQILAVDGGVTMTF